MVNLPRQRVQRCRARDSPKSTTLHGEHSFPCLIIVYVHFGRPPLHANCFICRRYLVDRGCGPLTGPWRQVKKCFLKFLDTCGWRVTHIVTCLSLFVDWVAFTHLFCVLKRKQKEEQRAVRRIAFWKIPNSTRFTRRQRLCGAEGGLSWRSMHLLLRKSYVGLGP